MLLMTTNIPIKLGKCPSIYSSSINLFIYEMCYCMKKQEKKHNYSSQLTHKTNERNKKKFCDVIRLLISSREVIEGFLKEMKKGLEIRSRNWGWKVASERYYRWEVSKRGQRLQLLQKHKCHIWVGVMHILTHLGHI